MNDLDAIFEHFTVDVTWGSAAFRAMFDMPDELFASGAVLSTEYQLLAKSEDISGIEEGEALTIDGAEYTVRSVRKIDDGKLTRLAMSKV